MQRGKHIVIGVCASVLLLLGLGKIGTTSDAIRSAMAAYQTEQAAVQTSIPLFPPIQLSEFTVSVRGESCSTRHFSQNSSVYSTQKSKQLNYTIVRFVRQAKHLKFGLLSADIIFPFQYFW